jgi:asparagine synthase (glutamine-hydrolysing)
MSGIISLLKEDRSPCDRPLLNQMTEFLAFRGPDDRQVWSQGSVGLGHTLLRTTAESDRQPLTVAEGGSQWIVADARIDDRANLRQKLRDRGCPVADNISDAQLILHAYRVWDTACVEHLMGDFVFIIWDDTKQRLFCARDHFGIVPFYYARINKTLICSNTLNCIRLHPGVSAKLNQQAMGDFLLFGMNMAWDTTSFADIRRLPPAHTLTWTRGKLEIQPYWQLPRCLPLIRYRRKEDYVEHFAELFQQAVADRLRSATVTTHISGGMDSTSVAATAYQVLEERGKPFEFHSFTMGDRSMMPEEDTYATTVAKHIGIPIHVLDVSGCISAIPPKYPETPIPEPAAGIPARNSQLELAKHCATKAPVVLTGFGGDPGLRFGEFFWLECFKHGLFAQWVAVQFHAISLYRHPLFYWRRGLGYWRKISRIKQSFPTWVEPNFSRRLDLPARQREIGADSVDKISRYGMAQSPFWSNLFETLEPSYTGVAIKHYHPFFDLRLVNYLIAIPPVPWLVNKNILREAMQEKLPQEILQRPKKVFHFQDSYSPMMRNMVDVWIGDLLKNTPGLSDYVNCEQLLALLTSPEPISPADIIALEKTLTVAYWLRSLQ